MQITCHKCNLIKEDTEFYRQDWRANRVKQRLRTPIRDYRSSWCKACKKLYDQERVKDSVVATRLKGQKSVLYQKDYPKYWAHRQASRAKRYGIIGFVSWEEWQAILTAHDNKCHWCQRELHISFLTLDHVIPLAEGGPHNKENVVPSCANCNHVRLWEMKVKYNITERNNLVTPTGVEGVNA